MTSVFVYCVHNGRRMPLAHIQRNPMTGRWSGAFGRNRARRAEAAGFSTYVGDDSIWRHRFACTHVVAGRTSTVVEARDETLDRVLDGVSEISLADLAANL